MPVVQSNSVEEHALLNKNDLVEHIANAKEVSSAAVPPALASLTGAVKAALTQKGTVMLVSFGTFSLRMYATRADGNSRTGDATQVKAVKVVIFRPDKVLKDAVS
ncbi:HU family DNA-binding protein [Noviherbaspirillum agri]